ncbi:hypothetical protein Taro_055075 [Colocasia esculenta]|uniref:Transposase Tnp1/En/Spm-like domain-containing protein n=1 Tax=Colocasia esculenta TaxID=4460 RepID=A0A843XQ33_COLES|nr:hypothetical protein [Colocasia esculenta]
MASWLVLEPLVLFRFYFRRYHNKGMERNVMSSHSITYLFLKSVPTAFSFTSYPYFMTTTWFSYSEIDAFEHKIRTFTDLSLNDSPMMTCESEELEDEGDNTMKVDDVGMKRKGRGPTMCHDVHALEDGKKICVKWDNLGQLVGKGGKSLRTFLGTVARNADKCPINVQSWDKMPQNCIEDVWLFIQKEKIGTDADRADVFIIVHTRKDGRPINEDCAIAIIIGKKVKLLDLENEQVAEGIVMSVDPKKIVMGRPIGHVYCEVSINYANKPDAPLFVKDDQRLRIKDAIGSHILWIQDYVLVDEAKQSLFSG